jgi:tubulin monoglycylase TTLL3/8
VERQTNERNSDLSSCFFGNALTGSGASSGVANSEYEKNVRYLKGDENIEVLSDCIQLKAHNHLENNWNLTNKKALFYNMKAYYEAIKENPFDYIPLTFHIKEGIDDKEFDHFEEYFNKRSDEVRENEIKRK